MNILEILVNALYRQAEGDEQAQKLIRAVAEAYNERMAEINRPVTADHPKGDTRLAWR